jgi:hypothetical protein
MKTLSLVIALIATAPAQQVLDRVILRFGSEIVTSLDVRQARLLKLVDVPSDTDDAYVTALVNRRLMLSEVRRNPPPEPAAESVEARYRDWSRGLGGDPADRLARAGMTDAGLRAWLSDDIRLQGYLANRFGGRSADVASWLAVLRQRAGLQ